MCTLGITIGAPQLTACDEKRKLLALEGGWGLGTIVAENLYQCLLDDGADIIENLLYILWCHLQFYLVHCKPVDMEGNLGVAGAGRPPMRRMQGGWAGGRVVGERGGG